MAFPFRSYYRYYYGPCASLVALCSQGGGPIFGPLSDTPYSNYRVTYRFGGRRVRAYAEKSRAVARRPTAPNNSCYVYVRVIYVRQCIVFNCVYLSQCGVCVSRPFGDGFDFTRYRRFFLLFVHPRAPVSVVLGGPHCATYRIYIYIIVVKTSSLTIRRVHPPSTPNGVF